MKKIVKRAFTVAEVLITLMVIGVLAVLSMPSIMLSHEKNTTQAGFADAYKEISKGIFNYASDNSVGCQGKISCTTLFQDDNTAELLATTFRAVKKGKNCWEGQEIRNNIDGSGSTTDLNDLSCFIDGKNRIIATQTVLGDDDESCTTDFYIGQTTATGAALKNKLQKSCGFVFVDLNGQKGPNTFGRDVFVFVATDAPPSYLYPVGGSLLKDGSYEGLSNWKEDKCEEKGEGRTCAGRIVEEGMKVKYLK